MKTLFNTVLFFAFLSSTIVQACSKASKIDDAGNIILEKPTDKLQKTKYIFRGLAYKTELIEAPELNSNEVENLHYIKVYFKPIEILKGNISENDYALSYNGYIGGCAPPILV